MRRIAFSVTVCWALLSSPAFASSYVVCGNFVDLAAGEVSGYELEISSQDDDYNGTVGINWNLKLAEKSSWLAESNNIAARSFKDANDNTIVEITIRLAQAITGPVGTRYKLIGLYNDAPVLEKYTMGGFAESVKIGTYKCQSAND